MWLRAINNEHTLHLLLIEPMGDVPDVEDGGRVLRLLGLLLPDPLLPRPFFQRLHRARTKHIAQTSEIRTKSYRGRRRRRTPRAGDGGAHQEVLALPGAGSGRAPGEHAPLVPLLLPQPHLPLYSWRAPLREKPPGFSQPRRASGESPREGRRRWRIGGGGGHGEPCLPDYVVGRRRRPEEAVGEGRGEQKPSRRDDGERGG